MSQSTQRPSGRASLPASVARSATPGSDNSDDYTNYRKMLDGFVSGLDDLLNDWCAKNTAGAPDEAGSSDVVSSPSSATAAATADILTGPSASAMNAPTRSSVGSVEDLVAAMDSSVVGGRDDSGDSEEDDVDHADGPDEDYNTPSIAANYNYHSLCRSEELTTVERLHASYELWFYPTLSRGDALQMMKNKALGVFMVRNSSKPGNYALSMRQDSPCPYIEHYLIQQRPEGLQIQGAEHFFDSLEELISHYCDYISGGMPTNLQLPQCVAEPTTRQQLFSAMERESAMLKLIEMSVLRPAAMTADQVTLLQEVYMQMRQDATRVCPPRTAFRRSVRMPAIISQFSTQVDRSSTVYPSGSVTLHNQPAAAARNLERPPLPPKSKKRANTMQQPSQQLLEPDLPKRGYSRSAPSDVPPPLPPKMKSASSLPRPGDSEYSSSPRSGESPKRTPPPIPRRGNIPGTLSEEDDDLPFQSPGRRHTLSSVDRMSLKRTQSNSSEMRRRNVDCGRDEDGYLLPSDDKDLSEFIADRQKRAGSMSRVSNGPARDDRQSHDYMELDKLSERGSTAEELVPAAEPNHSSEDNDISSSQAPNDKAQRVLGMDDHDQKRTPSTRGKPTAWIRNFGVRSRFGKSATERVVTSITKYATSKSTIVGQNIDMFLTKNMNKTHDNPIQFTDEIRKFMNTLKSYLLGQGRDELSDILSHNYNFAAGEEINIGSILESSLHKVLLKPLKPVIYKAFMDQMTKNGTLSNLRNCLKIGKKMSLKELGVSERLIPPQGPSLHQIGQHLVRMQKAFSPTAKVRHMLAAVQAIYKSVKDTQAELRGGGDLVLGADDFLPMMVYVLCQLEVWKMEVETEYMWGLLEESQKVSEGGYYLTTMSGAVRAIGLLDTPEPEPTPASPPTSQPVNNHQPIGPTRPRAQAIMGRPSSASPDAAAGDGSASNRGSRAQSSASPPYAGSPSPSDQRMPSIADIQSIMRIHLDDGNGKTVSSHALPITTQTTVADACRLVARKLDIKDPERYALYQVVGTQATILKDDDRPQYIKAEWLADNVDYGQDHTRVERYFAFRIR